MKNEEENKEMDFQEPEPQVHNADIKLSEANLGKL